MKKIIFIAVSVILLASFCMPLGVNAALTDAQKQTLIEFTDKFIEDGNADGKIQYGIKEVWRTYQLYLSYNDEVYTTTKNGTRQKILFMMNPKGYKNMQVYLDEVSGGKGGYIENGDYLCLDCSAFTCIIYKLVFGLRFDYIQDSTARNWSTLHFLDQNYYNLRAVIGLNGKTTHVFKEIYHTKTSDGTLLPMSKVLESATELEVGDIIVGRNETSGWGHIGFYGGDGYMYHSSSTPAVNEDGSLSPYLIRKQKLSEISNNAYTILRVLRIADNILPEDFAGYNVPVDFASLSKESTPYDNAAPAFTRFEISEGYVRDGNKKITIKVSDEFGTDPVLYLASDKSTVLKGSGYGESGVLGVYTNATGELPKDVYEMDTNKKTDYEYYYGDGTYYFWVRDAAENVSLRYKAVIGGDVSSVYRTEQDGSETLIAEYGKDRTKVIVELTTAKETTSSPSESSDLENTGTQDNTSNNKTKNILIMVALSVIALAAVAVIVAVIISKRKAQ